MQIDAYKLFNQMETLRAELFKLETLLTGSQVESQTTDDFHIQVLHLRELISFLDKELKPVQQKMDALLLKDQITFDLFWRLFPEGSDVTFKDHRTGFPCAGKVHLAYV